ncbi:predicted protein [Streptomyces sp. C]|nr:predicted protein [Streptomyces sp. C]
MTPSSAVSTARVGARPVWTSSSAGPSAPRPRSSLVLADAADAVLPSSAPSGAPLPFHEGILA